MPEPAPNAAVPRRILLDVDGTLLLPFRADPNREAVSGAGLPAGAVTIDAPWPGGGGGTFRAWYRPAAITALRRAHDAGIAVIWSTSWLAGDPAALDELATIIGAGFVRRPTVEELPGAPSRFGIDTSSRLRMRAHWELRAWRRHLETAETALIDDEAYFGAYPFADEGGLHRGGWIRPRYGAGFGRVDTAALNRWIRDCVIPATLRRPW